MCSERARGAHGGRAAGEAEAGPALQVPGGPLGRSLEALEEGGEGRAPGVSGAASHGGYTYNA